MIIKFAYMILLYFASMIATNDVASAIYFCTATWIGATNTNFFAKNENQGN